MIRRLGAAITLALAMIPAMATGAFAQDLVDSDAIERAQCLVRVYIQEGDSWEECLS